jgi:hypothetical protein
MPCIGFAIPFDKTAFRPNQKIVFRHGLDFLAEAACQFISELIY